MSFKMEGDLAEGSLDMEKEIEVPGYEEEDGPSPRNRVAPSDEIPNGGWLAWLQVVGSFFLFFNSWGK